VDYLRTAYSADFLIAENPPTKINGRFYRAPKTAELYREPTVFRSGIWLDSWDTGVGLGDTLENKKYNMGARDFAVVDSSKTTRKVQRGCDKRLEVVEGTLGFPLGCRPVRPGIMELIWNSSTYKRGDPEVWQVNSANALPFRLTQTGDFKWEGVWDNGSTYFEFLLTFAYGVFRLRSSQLSSTQPPVVSDTEWTPDPSSFPYNNVPATISPPWSYLYPSEPLVFGLYDYNNAQP